jgi:hypothetical protein
MLCDFDNNVAAVLVAPRSAICRVCGRIVTTTVFPILAECNPSPIDDCYPCGKRRRAAEAHAPQAPAASVGLGDTVAWLAGMVGIRPWAGCNCDARRAWLNKWFPFWWRK